MGLATCRTVGIILLLSPAPPAVARAQSSPPLRVEGEIRTVHTSGAVRLWGRGRPTTEAFSIDQETGEDCRNGSIVFGLSRHAVDWGSAADACPVGTWVCRSYQIVKCDTDRPDETHEDWRACSGSFGGSDSDQHPGWVADASTTATVHGRFRYEHDDTIYIAKTCVSLPVWCCWE